MAVVVRYRIMFNLAVPGELAGTHLDIEYNDSAAEGQVLLGTDTVWEWWDTGVEGGVAAKGLWADELSLVSVSGQKIDAPIGPTFIDQRTPIAGTYAGSESLPPQAAVVASYTTNESARRQRGRSFLPPPPEDRVNTIGVLVTAYAQSVIDVVQNLAAAMEAPQGIALPNTTAEHVIWSTRARDEDGVLLPPEAFQVTRYRLGTRVDTQRRRLGSEQTYLSS